jgi:hypothetical protein
MILRVSSLGLNPTVAGKKFSMFAAAPILAKSIVGGQTFYGCGETVKSLQVMQRKTEAYSSIVEFFNLTRRDFLQYGLR